MGLWQIYFLVTISTTGGRARGGDIPSEVAIYIVCTLWGEKDVEACQLSGDPSANHNMTVLELEWAISLVGKTNWDEDASEMSTTRDSCFTDHNFQTGQN